MSIENEFVDYMENFLVAEKLVGLNTIKKYHRNTLVFGVCKPNSIFFQMKCNYSQKGFIEVCINEVFFSTKVCEKLKKDFHFSPSTNKLNKLISSNLTLNSFYHLIDFLSDKWNY